MKSLMEIDGVFPGDNFVFSWLAFFHHGLIPKTSTSVVFLRERESKKVTVFLSRNGRFDFIDRNLLW